MTALSIMVTMMFVTIILSSCSDIIEQLPTYEESTKVRVGDMAPNFIAHTSSSEIIELEKCRGEVVVVIFVSLSCADCKALLDNLNEQIIKLENEARVIAIARDSTNEQVEAYLDGNGYSINIAGDPQRAIYSLYATTYVPRCYLIDPTGRVDMLTIEYHQDDVEKIISRAKEL